MCGILEFIVEFLLFHGMNIRLWNYNTEPWNFGNIAGYVCLRSVAIFGLFGFLLFLWGDSYNSYDKESSFKKFFRAISCLLALAFIADIITHMILKGMSHF